MIVRTPVNEAPLKALAHALITHCREENWTGDMAEQARIMRPLVTSYLRGTLTDMGCETVPVIVPTEEKELVDG